MICLYLYEKNLNHEHLASSVKNDNTNTSMDINSSVFIIDKTDDIQKNPDMEYETLQSSGFEEKFFRDMATRRETAIQNTEKSFSVNGVRQSKTLNLRTGPGTGFDVIGKIPNRVSGIKIIHSESPHSEWVLINILTNQGYVNGWVHRAYLLEE